MIFTIKDLEMLLDQAVKTGRDLQLSINTDGTYDVHFDIPRTTTSSWTQEADQKKNQEGDESERQ